MEKRLNAKHGIICRLPGERFGYFGWPTVERLKDGTLFVASSGLRSEHICPWGKTVLNVSYDRGETWSPPRVIQDSPIDDRDAGIIKIGDNRLLVSWFRSDTRRYFSAFTDSRRKEYEEVFAKLDDEQVKELLGSWIMTSNDSGKTWSLPVRVPVSAPHGPVLLGSGNILYLGKDKGEMTVGKILCAISEDAGLTWKTVGEVPVLQGTDAANYHEPHVVELPSGRLIGMIRVQNYEGKSLEDVGIPSFSMMQTESDNGGHTWTTPRPLGFHGSPPHLLRHSSGVLILTYGYRLKPFGQRVAFSYDEGVTWDNDWIIRDDGPDGDLGYPSTVELSDGSLFTVYYQKAAPGEKCSLLWSSWGKRGQSTFSP